MRAVRDLVKMLDEEMDGVAREERQKLETVEDELSDVRRRMDRLWHAVETSDLEINDILPRIRQHQERQERLETAAQNARTALSERRAVLDSVKTIPAYAQEMSEFLAAGPSDVQSGRPGRDRTSDRWIKSPLLYH